MNCGHRYMPFWVWITWVQLLDFASLCFNKINNKYFEISWFELFSSQLSVNNWAKKNWFEINLSRSNEIAKKYLNKWRECFDNFDWHISNDQWFLIKWIIWEKWFFAKWDTVNTENETHMAQFVFEKKF